MGSLRLQLSDGLNKGQEVQFRIRIKELNIRLQNHEQLDVFPMTQSPLRTDHLLVVTSDYEPPSQNQTTFDNTFGGYRRREIHYVVTSPPKLGVLLHSRRGRDRMTSEARNFTQRDVDEGRVFYKHIKPFSNLTVYDSVELEASAEYAKRRIDLVFNVRISVTAGAASSLSENEERPGIERYIESEDVRVTEGGSAIFRKKNFDTSGILTFIKEHRQAASGGSDQYHQYLRTPQLELEITQLPMHGELTISKERAQVRQRFRQTDIDRGFLAYKHDDSDTLVDFYGIAVYLIGDKSERYGDGRGHSGDILLSDAVWNISITPINDRSFHLVSNDGMTVVQRQGKAITRNMLYTQDDDTTPEDLVYVVQNSPIHGRLVFSDNITRPATRFTQQDIDQRRIVYFHDSDGIQPDQFRFRVSDLKFPPVYRHFRIIVSPLTLELTNSSAIFIQQGTRMAYITAYNMGSKTNGQRSNTYYNITTQPNAGRLELNGAPSSMFSQINVDNEEVVYIQTVMTFANDSFVATIVNQDAVKKNQVFKIIVLPLVKRNGTLVCNLSGDKNVPFQQHHLDASQLAGLTNSNPIYFVLEPPRYGRLMRIIKPSSSSSSRGVDQNGKSNVGLKSLRHKEVTQFTHEDIKNGVVYFVPSEKKLNLFLKNRESYNGIGNNGAPSINDSFRYRLEAPGVQPANGALEFIISDLPVSILIFS